MHIARCVHAAEFDLPRRLEGSGHEIPSSSPVRRLVADIGQQRHEARPLHGPRYGMLADGRATGLTAYHNPTVSIDQFLKEFDILVIDVHGTRAFAIDENRIFFDRLCTCLISATSTSSRTAWG